MLLRHDKRAAEQVKRYTPMTPPNSSGAEWCVLFDGRRGSPADMQQR
jgi:hypothetical protein